MPTTAATWWPRVRTCSRGRRTSTSPSRRRGRSRSTGYQPGRSIVLVRNPSWDRRRPTSCVPPTPTRSRSSIGGVSEDLALKVDVRRDRPGARRRAARRTRSSGTRPIPPLKDRIHSNPSDAVRYIEMNLANPPFDDVHVRRARQLRGRQAGLAAAPRRTGLRRARRPHHGGQPAERPAAGLRPVSRHRDGAGDLEEGEGGDGSVEVRHATGRGLRRRECEGMLTFTDAAAPYPEAVGA